jgi:hypothetical protein
MDPLWLLKPHGKFVKPGHMSHKTYTVQPHNVRILQHLQVLVKQGSHFEHIQIQPILNNNKAHKKYKHVSCYYAAHTEQEYIYYWT